MSDSLSRCNYYLFAQVTDDLTAVEAYAGEMVGNPRSILDAPVIVDARYDLVTGKTKVHYEKSTDPTAAGYIVDVTDSSGKDSTYAVLNIGGSLVLLDIDDYETKTVKMTTFNENGLKGCPSAAKNIATVSRNISYNNGEQNNLVFYPNPTTGKGFIKFKLEDRAHCIISIIDFSGRLIAQPVSGNKPAGTHLQEWDFGGLPNGMYLILMQAGGKVSTAKCILSR